MVARSMGAAALALLAVAATAGVLAEEGGGLGGGLGGGPARLPAALVKAFLLEAHVTRTPAPALLLLCGARGAEQTARQLAAHALPVQVVDEPARWLQAVRALDRVAHSVVLDAACPGARALLASADELDMLRYPRRWVLVFPDRHPPADGSSCSLALEPGAPGAEAMRRCYCRTAALLDGLGVLYDSDVSALCADAAGSAVAVSAHRTARGAVLRLQRAAAWRGVNMDDGRLILEDAPPPDRRHLAARRLDFHEAVSNVGLVITDPKSFWKGLDQVNSLIPDLMAIFSWDIVHEVVAMLNMTMNMTITNDWGRTPPAVTPDKGLMGLQVRQEIEFTGTGFSTIIEPHRLRYNIFTNFYVPADGILVFRAPPLSYENNVFTLPFPLSLWEASLGMVALCAALLIVVMHAERVMLHQGEAPDALHSGSDAILLAIAAVCQQGSPVETRGVPGRIIALLLFVLVLLLYTCYSASIVVLMQRTSTTIRHYRDLPDSRIKVGAVDIPYVWHYLKVEDDPVRQRVIKEKMLEKGKKRHAYSLAEGIRKVRKDYFCFLGIQNQIYAEISNTWQEHEKCGLVTIGRDFFRVTNPQYGITRGSHRVDAYKIMLRRIAERGIWHRMLRRFVRQKPGCATTDAVFHSVTLTDCRGAFQMYLMTLAASVLVFLLELAAHRRQQRSRRARAARQAAAEAQRKEAFIGGLNAEGLRAKVAEWSGRRHEFTM